MEKMVKDAHDISHERVESGGRHHHRPNVDGDVGAGGNKEIGNVQKLDQRLPSEPTRPLKDEMGNFKRVAAGPVDHASVQKGQDPAVNKGYAKPPKGGEQHNTSFGDRGAERKSAGRKGY